MDRRVEIFCATALMLGIVSLSFLQETVLAGVAQSAVAERKTIWSGVYTETEAKRGQPVYEAECRGCHGASLEGLRTNPPLQGDRFMDSWREGTLEGLFTKMRNLMPRRDPGKLTEREYLDILAYVLQSNQLPAGPDELDTNVLQTIQIEGKDGPKPLPNRTNVKVVGCLTQAGGDDWMLTMAPPPNRTDSPDKATQQDMQDAASSALGTLTFRLQNLLMLGDFDTEKHSGHKMLAKGVLIRRSAGERISLTWMQMVSPNCGQ